ARPFTGTPQARREARQGMVVPWCAGGAPGPAGRLADAGVECLVWWLLEPDGWPHQSAGADARPCQSRVEPRCGDLRTLASRLHGLWQRPMDGEDGERIGERPRACPGDQCLYRRIREAARATDRPRGDPRALLADGDEADQRQCRQDRDSRSAGYVRYSSRTLFRPLGCPQSLGDGRRVHVPRAGRRALTQAGRRTIAAALAADRRRGIRLRLVRLRRHDTGQLAPPGGTRFSAHPRAGPQWLCLGWLQRTRGGAVDLART